MLYEQSHRKLKKVLPFSSVPSDSLNRQTKTDPQKKLQNQNHNIEILNANYRFAHSGSAKTVSIQNLDDHTHVEIFSGKQLTTEVHILWGQSADYLWRKAEDIFAWIYGVQGTGSDVVAIYNILLQFTEGRF